MQSLVLNFQPYQFSTPPGYNWLPSPDDLFEFDSSGELDLSDDEYDRETTDPTQQAIREACQALQESWSEWETEMRQIRSEAAIQTGVCRNH